MFVFLWLWVICSLLWLCCCVTVKPADQLNLQLGEQRDTGTRHFYARIQQSPEFCKVKHRAFPVWAPVKEFLRRSQVLSPHFLQFFTPPMATRQHCLCPFRTHILFVKSHPRCISVLSSLLFWFALCVCRGRVPNLNKRSGGITTGPPVPGPPRCFAC